jgi:hypothetical protein
MACLSCSQARTATASAIKAAATGNLHEAATQAARATDALKDKAESLRVRMLMRRV